MKVTKKNHIETNHFYIIVNVQEVRYRTLTKPVITERRRELELLEGASDAC